MRAQSRTRFPLGKNEVVTLAYPKGWSIKAHTGRLWITQSNKSEDIFLDAGQIYIAKEAGLLVAEAISHALVSFESPVASNLNQYVTKTSDLISKESIGLIPAAPCAAAGAFEQFSQAA